jgi:HSP20 family protein
MMTLVRWQPWQEMEAMRRQMDRMLEDFAPVKRVEPTWKPAVELKSNDTEFVLRAQLPGIEAKDLDIKVSRNGVALSGEHQFENTTEENGYLHSEFRYGKFQRVIPLPAPVQNDQVQAEFKDGILTLTLPKVQAIRPSVVKVNLVDAEENKAEIAPASEAPAPETEDVWEAQG